MHPEVHPGKRDFEGLRRPYADSRPWGLYEDASDHGRFVETFLVESWLEHLRQHERVTNADRVLQENLESLLTQASKTSHFVAARFPRG